MNTIHHVRIENVRRILERLIFAAANLSDEEAVGLAELAGDTAIRSRSPDLGAWLHQICDAEQRRRKGDDVQVPAPPDWKHWTDAETAAALETMILLNESAAVASERARDLTDAMLALVAGVAITRLNRRHLNEVN